MKTTNLFKNTKANFFILGVAAATAGVKLVKSDCFKKGCTKALVEGMKIRGNFSSEVSIINNDADDEYYTYCVENGKADLEKEDE